MSSPISVVIPCKDDRRIRDCVAAFDPDVPLVISFNGAPADYRRWVVDLVADRPVEFSELTEANLSKALEVGISAARTPWVLLMDSDCIMRPGGLDAVVRAMEVGRPDTEVYKGQVVFAEQGGPFAGMIARTRHDYTARVLTAYKPPLAFYTVLRERVGGYFFDERLPWKEDADLDCRIRSAGIGIVAVDECVIDHAALSLREDLRSNYRYGVGAAIADHLGIEVLHPDRSLSGVADRAGLVTAGYLAVANGAKRLGRWQTSRRLRHG